MAQAGLLEEAKAAQRRAEADLAEARRVHAADTERLKAVMEELAEERRERMAAKAAAAAAAAQVTEHRSDAQVRPMDFKACTASMRVGDAHRMLHLLTCHVSVGRLCTEYMILAFSVSTCCNHVNLRAEHSSAMQVRCLIFNWAHSLLSMPKP